MNSHDAKNITFKMSTPGEYIESLKKENIEWPVRYEDLMPYSSDHPDDNWTGFFSSRPGAKKMVKDSWSLFNAQAKLFAQRVIRLGVKKEEVDSILLARDKTMREASIYLHHDAITGTAR